MKILFFLLFTGNIFAENYNIESYISRTLSTSHAVKEYAENARISANSYSSALAALYIPSAQYSISDSPWSSSRSGFALRERDFSSQISLSYNFFNNFSDSIDLRQAALNRASAERSLWLKKQETVYSAMKRYCDVLKYSKLLEVTRASEKSYSDEYEKSMQYYKEGLRSYSDLLKSELNYKNARLSSLYYENLYKNALMEFNYAIYEDPLAEVKLSEIVFDESLPDESLSVAVKYALENRRDLMNYEDSLKVKELELRRKLINYFPQFSALAEYSRSEVFGLGNTYGPKDNYSLTLSMKIPFGYELFSKRENYDSARFYLEREKRALEEMRLSIKKEVASLALDLSYALEKYGVSRTNSEISKNNLEIIKQKYSEGKASVIDLIEAQKDDLSAKSDLAESYYDLYLKKAEYDKALGRALWRDK